MKKNIVLLLIIINTIFIIPTYSKNKKLILQNYIIAIDPGHGGKDAGASYKNIYEKTINLKISLKLKEELEKYGATIIITRTNDYDLSSPKAKRRKKSDFDNRIKIINKSKANLFISIHQNYFNDTKYSGTQIFYKDDKIKKLAETLQKELNTKRKIKKISNTLYMYNKLSMPGLLIESGFLSNTKDRTNLQNTKYIEAHVIKIRKKIIHFHKNHM